MSESSDPKHCGLRHKIASKCLQVFEAMMAKILLIISICSIVYANTWLPVFINFSFFLLAIFAMVTYAQCYRRVQPVLVLPMLIHQSVCIFWIFIWLYASVASITTGALWSLEWLGGPKSSREKTSSDIKDPNYANPNETHPEITKSIKYGMLITIASLIILCLKCVAWIIARRTWRELRARKIELGSQKVEEESDLSDPSPSYPLVVRVPAVKTPPPAYETEPLKRTSLQARLLQARQNMRQTYFLLLFLTSIALALETDGGFEKFCKSEWLDSSVLEPAARYMKSPTPKGKARCKQIYKIGVNFNADGICDDLSSFDVGQQEISKDRQELTCVWESQGICDDDSILIGSKCYGKFGSCPYGWALAETRNSHVVQFISKYYPDDELLKVTTINKSVGVYHSGVIHRDTAGFNLTGPMAVVLKRHSANGVYPGEHVLIHDERKNSHINTLCQRPTTNLGKKTDEGDPESIFGEGESTHYGQAATAYKPLCSEEGHFCMKPPRNQFQPEMTKKGVNIGGYHDYCANICKGCFAASGYHYTKRFMQGPLPNERYYVPIARTTTIQGSDDCNTTPKPDSYMPFEQQTHPDIKSFQGSHRKIWSNGYPANKCSDSGRLAAQFVQRGGQAEGVIDVPVFDRAAIYCVKGPKPPPPEIPSCLANSFYDEMAKKCKCKANFKDAYDTDSDEDWVRKKVKADGYEKEYVCLWDLTKKNTAFMTCKGETKDTFKTEAVIFLIDASGSIWPHDWDKIIAFLRNSKAWLPKNQKILFCRYHTKSCDAKPILPKQWSDAQFDTAVNLVQNDRCAAEQGVCDNLLTFTYTALDTIVNVWIGERSSSTSKALLLLITDGAAWDENSNPEPPGTYAATHGDKRRRRGAVQKARHNNARIIAVTVGQNLPMDEDVVNPATDIIRVDNYGNLAKEVMNRIVTEKCKHEPKHFEDATKPQ